MVRAAAGAEGGRRWDHATIATGGAGDRSSLGSAVMAVYRGVVRGNTVVLEEPVDLADGAVVEVRPVVPPADEASEGEREAAFLRHLLAIGMIQRIPPRLPDPPWLDRTPLEIEGPPLSQTLIEDRR